MKQIFALLTLLLVLVGCSSSRIDRSIDDSSWDSLADESFLRWGDKRLNSADAKLTVVGCYKGQTKETLEQFKKNYITDSNQPLYWLHVGNCYFVDEKWTKAEFFYRMALEESKNDAVKSIAYNNIGLISFKYEQWEKGRELLKQSMKIAPRSKVPRYNLSQLYLQFGLYDKAIEVLSDSAFRGHNDIDVYFSLANAYLYKNDLKTADSYFSKIPKDYFTREDIAATYALYLVKMNRTKEAKVVMDKRQRSSVPELSSISHKIEKMISQKLKEEKL